MSNETQLAASTAPEKRRASHELAHFIGMAPDAMIDTIKAQCFKCSPSQVTDAQLGAFVAIANEMKVNPLIPGMLYAYPIQGGGIVPVMGPDGVFKKLCEHPDIDSWDVTTYPEDGSAPTHATALIFRKSTERPAKYTAWLSEWKVGSNPNWNSRPRHMLFIRALKQAARQIIHGIPFDEDERHMMNITDVTPDPLGSFAIPDKGQPRIEATPIVTRPEIPARGPGRPKKGLAAAASTPVADVEDLGIRTAATPAPAATAPVIEAETHPILEEMKAAEPLDMREPIGILTNAEGEETDLFDPATAIKPGEYIRGNITISGFKAGKLKDGKLFCGQNAITYMTAEGAFKGTLYTHLHGNAALADGKTVKVVIESKTDDKGASQPFIKTIAE